MGDNISVCKAMAFKQQLLLVIKPMLIIRKIYHIYPDISGVRKLFKYDRPTISCHSLLKKSNFVSFSNIILWLYLWYQVMYMPCRIQLQHEQSITAVILEKGKVTCVLQLEDRSIDQWCREYSANLLNLFHQLLCCHWYINPWY